MKGKHLPLNIVLHWTGRSLYNKLFDTSLVFLMFGLPMYQFLIRFSSLKILPINYETTNIKCKYNTIIEKESNV